MRTRGFTLVELLLAIAVMALLAALGWRGVDAMVRAREVVESRSAEVMALQAGLSQWSADLDAMEATGQLPAIDWDGQVLRLTRRAPVSDAPSLRVVAWSRRLDANGARWLRWESPPVTTREQLLQSWELAGRWARSPDAALRQREVAIVALDDWQLFYYRNDAWTNPQSSAAGQGGPGGVPVVPGAATVPPPPDGVRLVLQLPTSGAIGGRLMRDWVQPTAGGGKS